MTILSTPRNDMSFCPGCSHGLVLERLAGAVERLGRRPEEVCVVTDIGCIGIADRYLGCHTFHGLHGRSVTYAEGIKRANPELTVIVLIGDGGCGIGSAHLIHAARRRANITVLVCNNFNFGMTGGQHSSTTPLCASTMTTPHGAADLPFDICRVVASCGAQFVARQSAHADESGMLIERALCSPGFSLVDLWELCAAYHVPANRLTPRGLVALSDQLQMPFGVIQERDDECPRASIRDALPVPSPDAVAEALCETVPLAWPGRAEICIAGSAGGRIRAAAGAFGEIAVAHGLHAAQRDDFPITVRKGHSISFLVIDDRPVLYTGVDNPDLVVLLSEDGLRRLGSAGDFKAGALVVAASYLDLPPTAAEVVRLDLGKIEREAGKPSAALAFLAAGLVRRQLIDATMMLRAAEETLTGRYRDAQLNAMRIGCGL